MKSMLVSRSIALGLLCLSGTVSAAVNVQADLPQPASLFVNSDIDGCDNSKGPYITMSGEMTLGGINGRLIFRNNTKGTHEFGVDTAADVVLLNEGEQIQFAKQPSQGGVGGNPWIYAQFFLSEVPCPRY